MRSPRHRAASTSPSRGGSSRHRRRPGLPGRIRGPELVLAVLLAAGCEGNGGTGVSASPSRLVLLSPAVDSVAVGGTPDGPLEVRLESSLGDAVEGVPVRFFLEQGPGSLNPALAVTDGEGRASSTFRPGAEFGSSRIRVDVPSATNVRAVNFRRVTVPARRVELRGVEGQGQTAEVGSQLAHPLVVEVTTEAGEPTADVRLAWEVDPPVPGVELVSDFTFTDPSGRAENLLTLGGDAVEHVVRVFPTGDQVGDTVAFTATAVESLQGPLRLDSVAPLPLPEDGEALLFGAGFGSDPGALEVRVEGRRAEILQVAGDSVRVRVPDFTDRCLPAREVGVRALLGGEPGNGLIAPLEPATPLLRLEPGESRTLASMDAIGCLRVAGAEGREVERLLLTASLSREAGASTPLRLVSRPGEEPEETISATTLEPQRLSLPRPGEPGSAITGAEATLRENVLRELERRGLARGDPPRPALRSTLEEVRVPATGDTLPLRFAVRPDLTISCTDTTSATRVEGVVRAVGEEIALLEDVDVPEGLIDRERWNALLDEFERAIFPTDTALFGAPADIDGNGRVLVLITPRVNALNPRTSSSAIAGFFLAADLVDRGDAAGGGVRGPGGEVCPTSNEGEILYLIAPDPAGSFSRPLEVARATDLIRTIGAHELMHLLGGEQRVILGSGDLANLGETWLQEGLAHLAEEAVGLALMGRSPGEDLLWREIVEDRQQLDLFNAFHINNFSRLDLFLRSPNTAPTLAVGDPGGVESLQMRGFAWSLVRWLADRAGTGARGAALVRRLTTGGPMQSAGVMNVERATGKAWNELLGDFLLTLAVDGREGIVAPAELEFPTWNLRDVFRGLSQNPTSSRVFPLPFPLRPVRLPDEPVALEFELGASTGLFFELPAVPTALRFTSQGGGDVPTSTEPVVTVIRLR